MSADTHQSYEPRALASCGDDLSIRIWDLSESNAPVRVIEDAHTSRIRSVVYCLDGSLLASCSDDGRIKVWDASTLTCLRELVGERPYERMNITDAQGLTDAQKMTLRTLGAIENNTNP